MAALKNVKNQPLISATVEQTRESDCPPFNGLFYIYSKGKYLQQDFI